MMSQFYDTGDGNNDEYSTNDNNNDDERLWEAVREANDKYETDIIQADKEDQPLLEAKFYSNQNKKMYIMRLINPTQREIYDSYMGIVAVSPYPHALTQLANVKASTVDGKVHDNNGDFYVRWKYRIDRYDEVVLLGKYKVTSLDNNFTDDNGNPTEIEHVYIYAITQAQSIPYIDDNDKMKYEIYNIDFDLSYDALYLVPRREEID
jgi:hypothetical protein